MLHKKLQNSQKNLSLWVPPHNPKIGPQAQNQKSTLPWLFGLSTGFQNGMSWPGSTNDHGAAPLQGKELGAGQGLPGEDWAGTLPTQKLFEANLASPEFFSNPSICSKVIHDFLFHRHTDAQIHRHTHTKIPYKTNHPSIWVQAEIFSTLLFLPHTKQSELASLICSLGFVWINGLLKQIVLGGKFTLAMLKGNGNIAGRPNLPKISVDQIVSPDCWPNCSQMTEICVHQNCIKN